MSLHLLPVFVPLAVRLSSHQGWDVLLGVVSIGVGPVVGLDPRNKEAIVFLLGSREILLPSLSGGLHQLVPGQEPAYKEIRE